MIETLNRLLRQVGKSRLPAPVTKADIEAGLLRVEIDHRSGGFFAQLNWCLYIFAYARAHAMTPHVTLVSRNYRRDGAGKDWFADYFSYRHGFEDATCEGSVVARKRISDFSQLGIAIAPDLTLREAHETFFATVAVLPAILAEVEAFVAHRFAGASILGVHYRGTDKKAEAPRVGYPDALRAIEAVLRADPAIAAVFLATDEAGFATWLRSNLRRTEVIVRGDAVRSTDGRPVHLRGRRTGAGDLGRDALVNALLLSRCDVLVRCSSFLSAWASIFNPGLPVHMLNRPYEKYLWYPEREILKHARPLPEAWHEPAGR